MFNFRLVKSFGKPLFSQRTGIILQDFAGNPIFTLRSILLLSAAAMLQLFTACLLILKKGVSRSHVSLFYTVWMKAQKSTNGMRKETIGIGG